VKIQCSRVGQKAVSSDSDPAIGIKSSRANVLTESRWDVMGNVPAPGTFQ
jgi:hypothetical protein